MHLHARWTVPVGEAVEIALFGGPTFFRASQELLTEVDFSQEYPYDTATLGRGYDAGSTTAPLSALTSAQISRSTSPSGSVSAV